MGNASLNSPVTLNLSQNSAGGQWEARAWWGGWVLAVRAGLGPASHPNQACKLLYHQTVTFWGVGC